MAMQDAEELNNMFHNISQDVETFTDKQLVWMNDTTSTNNQQLVFDNNQLMSRATIWKTALVRIPIHWQASIQGPTASINGSTLTIDPYSPGATPISLKCGPATMFSGIQVNLSTGTGILNDQISPFFLNQMRPKFEMNDEGLNTYGAEAGYCPDYFPNASLPLAPLTYGGTAISQTNSKPAFGASMVGQTFNGVNVVNSTSDYTLANTALYNQPFEFILNPVKILAITAQTATPQTYNASGILTASPNVFLGTNIASSANNGTYYVPLNEQNFIFSSNALLAIQQPAVVQFTIATTGLVTAAASIIATASSIGAGYGTDGTLPNVASSGASPESQIAASTNGVAVTANIFTAQLRVNAVGVTAAGVSSAIFTALAVQQLPIFAVQVGFSLPGLVPQGTEPEYRQGYSDLSCKNPFYNQGFQKRMQSWWANTTVATAATASNNTIYRTDVIARLQNLHDFFRQLDFPIENTRLQLFLNLTAPWNTSAAGSYFGMQYGTPVVNNPPIFQISQSPTTNSGTLQNLVVPSSCTLYFNAVSFGADSAIRLKNALSNPQGGLVKKLDFLEGEVTNFASNSVSATLFSQIQTTSTRVKRIWFCGIPVGSVSPLTGKLASTGFSGQSSSVAQPYHGFVPTARMTGCNLKVNGMPWRQNVLSTDWEFFEKLREQMAGFGDDENVGAKIDYIQWLAGVGLLYVFDLQRQGVRPSINDPILLNVDIVRAADLNFPSGVTGWTYPNTPSVPGTLVATSLSPVDWYCIVEKESTVQLNIGTANAAAIKQY